LVLGMTKVQLSSIRVKRKGQVTIPQELRSKLGIEEGSFLEVEEQKGAIIMRPAPKLKGGKVVGEKQYKKLIKELDHLRRSWH
jgi:AbrB family looped-hinge helix DNA binding protein